MALDISGFSFFIPTFVFLLVFVVVYALLAKLKILGENKFIHLLVSFVIAIIFLTFSSAREVVLRITPWFAVLIILLFFILAIIGFSQKNIDDMMKPWLAWVFMGAMVLIFLIVLANVFGYSAIEAWDTFLSYEKIAGAVLLLIIAGLAAWVITRK